MGRAIVEEVATLASLALFLGIHADNPPATIIATEWTTDTGTVARSTNR
jgi:hypothetical protein